MSGNCYIRRMEDRYDTIFRQCVSLNTELHKLVPLAKKMHLLSSNAICSAARAGNEGDVFRVLTQDIQLLGEDVSDCIEATQKVIGEIVTAASHLVRLFSNYLIYVDLNTRVENTEIPTTAQFFEQGQEHIASDIKAYNHKLSRGLSTLTNLLAPISILVKKGEYLTVFSSVEAANAGEYGVSFNAISSMLRKLVRQLSQQSTRQRSLLRDLTDAIELQQNDQGKLFHAH